MYSKLVCPLGEFLIIFLQVQIGIKLTSTKKILWQEKENIKGAKCIDESII